MSAPVIPDQTPSTGTLPETEAEIKRNVATRRRSGNIWRTLFLSSLIVGLIALVMLIYTVVDDSFGPVVYQYRIPPAQLSDRPLEELSSAELITIIQKKVSAGRFRQLNREQPLDQRSQASLVNVVLTEVSRQQIVETYPLTEWLFNRAAVEADAKEQHPDGDLRFRAWISRDFLTNPMSSNPSVAGIRTAILGSLWVVILTMLIAVPIGIGAAIYLEEYATKNRFNQIIETNINNLAGVPSIIYGMLGLAIFVRALEHWTSGAFLGVQDSNGRTIVSAALTMALLVLPLLIIASREAIRAVPQAIREASYGLGATKWQTVWHHVLPMALPGILTGTILAMSRAIGESAPLIIVGASTFIVTDPTGPFSKFTVLPIQVYNWVQQPGEQWISLAASAIIILLIILLSLNALAIWLRNRYRGSV